MRIDQENAQEMIVFNNHLFKAFNDDTYDLIQPINYCDEYLIVYFLDSLEISEKIYLEEDLSRDITKKDGFFVLEYSDFDSQKCVTKVILYLDLVVPVYLNDELLENENKNKILSSITLDDIISLKKKKKLFGGWYLDIQLKM